MPRVWLALAGVVGMASVGRIQAETYLTDGCPALGAGLPVEASSAEGGVRCCDQHGACFAATAAGDCYAGQVNFSTAEGVCEVRGLRLCSLAELATDICCTGDACLNNMAGVWVRDVEPHTFAATICDQLLPILLPKDLATFPAARAGIACCTDFGCSIGDAIGCWDAQVPFAEARDQCAAKGQRLCSLSELKTCCLGLCLESRTAWYDNCLPQNNCPASETCVMTQDSFRCSASTEAPATESPATQPPATQAPATQSPATQAPATPAPATQSQAPATPAPATQSPATESPATQAPATQSPATQAPTTQSPATLAPTTQSPATQSPATEASATQSPAIHALATLAPVTQSPATQAPVIPSPATQPPATLAAATVAPETAAPPPVFTFYPETAAPAAGAPTFAPTPPADADSPVATGESEKAPIDSSSSTNGTRPTAGENRALSSVDGSSVPGRLKETIETVAKIGAVVSIGSPKIAVMVNFECKVEDVDLDDEPLDWEFHPLAFSIGNHKKKYFVGALVGNTCLCAGFFAAQYLVAWAIMSIWSISWGTAVFFARAPGLVAIPLMALLTGTALSSFNLALYPHSAGTLPSIVGAVGVAVCILFPLILWNCLFSLPQFKAATVPDPKLALHEEGSSFLTKDTPSGSSHHYESPDVFSSSWTKSAYIFAFGRRVWVRHSDAPPFWVEQWGMFFEGFKQGFHWFSLVEIVEILCISLLSVWRPVEFAPCMSRNLLLTVVVSGYFGSIVYYRPHNAPLDLWVSVLTSGTTMLAIILISVSIALRGNPAWLVEALTTTSAVLLLISALFTLGKGVYDITLYFVDLRIGRRKDARKLDKAYNRTSPQVRGVNAQELSLWESTDDETDSEQVTARSQRVAASPSVFAHGTPDEKLCLRDTPTALSNRQNSVEARTADHRARARSIASSTLCSPLRPPHQKASYSSKSSSPALFHSPDEFPIDFGVAPYFLQQPPPTRPRRMSSLVTLAPSRSFPEHLLLAPAGRSPRLLPKPNSRATVSLQT